MNQPCRSPLQSRRAPILVIINLLLVACSPPVERPKGAAADFEDAKQVFKLGRYDRALELTDGMATVSPPSKFTDRARVLRAVIFTGRIKAYKSLAEAYTKGSDATKNPHFKAEFGQQRHDCLQLGSKSALGLGEVAQQLTQGETLPKELSLEAPYPTVEGPYEVRELMRVSDGGWIEPEQQESAAVDAVRKGIDDTLAEIVEGDRSKARTVLSAGPVNMDGVDFALYLEKQLLEGATFFDRKHMRDPQKFKTLLGVADGTAKAVLTLLKEKPNKDKESEVKKIQDQIKTALKNA